MRVQSAPSCSNRHTGCALTGGSGGGKSQVPGPGRLIPHIRVNRCSSVVSNPRRAEILRLLFRALRGFLTLARCVNATWTWLQTNILGSGLVLDVEDPTLSTTEFYRVRAVIP